MKKKANVDMMLFIFSIILCGIVLVALFFLQWIPNQERQEDLNLRFASKEAQVLLTTFLRTPVDDEFRNLPGATLTYADILRNAANEQNELLTDYFVTSTKIHFQEYNKEWSLFIYLWQPENNQWVLWKDATSKTADFSSCSVDVGSSFMKNLRRGVTTFGSQTSLDTCINVNTYQIMPNYQDNDFPLIAAVFVTSEGTRNVKKIAESIN